jgi:hypothetical protein
MSQHARISTPTLYDSDFFAWLGEQSRLLRARRPAGLDWENLAEEIETLGRSERAEIRSRVEVLLVHPLKWQFQSNSRSAGWRGSLLEQRDQLNQVLSDSPSLKPYPSEVLDRQYRIARLKAAGETDLPLETFPEDCPFTIGQILDESFHPGEAP